MKQLTTSNLTLNEFKKKNKTKGWALSVLGYIVYFVLRLFKKPKDFYGIPYFEIGNGTSGMELGQFFVCGKKASERLKMHEVGHGVQNAEIGGLTMAFYSFCSFCRYWWREIFGAKTTYDSWWFEGNATKLGTEFINRIKQQQNN